MSIQRERERERDADEAANQGPTGFLTREPLHRYETPRFLLVVQGASPASPGILPGQWRSHTLQTSASASETSSPWLKKSVDFGGLYGEKHVKSEIKGNWDYASFEE